MKLIVNFSITLTYINMLPINVTLIWVIHEINGSRIQYYNAPFMYINYVI